MDYKDVIKQIEIQMPQTVQQSVSSGFEEQEKENKTDLLNEIGLELKRKGGI